MGLVVRRWIVRHIRIGGLRGRDAWEECGKRRVVIWAEMWWNGIRWWVFLSYTLLLLIAVTDM
jgi:hypothetical protein